MKRIIKCNTDDTRQSLAHGYVMKKVGDVLSINKPRPYDDAEYYWAKYDESKQCWNIIFKGKVVNALLDADYDIEDVVDELEMVNSSIKPKMVHN